MARDWIYDDELLERYGPEELECLLCTNDAVEEGLCQEHIDIKGE